MQFEVTSVKKATCEISVSEIIEILKKYVNLDTEIYEEEDGSLYWKDYGDDVNFRVPFRPTKVPLSEKETEFIKALKVIKNYIEG